MKRILPAVLLAMVVANAPRMTPYGQRVNWVGRVEYESGIKTVINPKEPLYGDVGIELDEDLRLADKPEYQFAFSYDMDVDRSGNIYVSNVITKKVLLFAKSGTFIRVVAGAAQGSPQMRHPTKIRMGTGNENVYVLDGGRTVYAFDAFGKILEVIEPRNVGYEYVIMDFIPCSHGSIQAVLWKSVNLVNTFFLCRITSQGNIEKMSEEFPYNLYMIRDGDNVTSVTTGFELGLHLAKVDRSHFVYGYSKEYALGVMDETGPTLLRIKMDVARPRFSYKEKASFRDIPVPLYKPYYYGILVDSLGRIYVQRKLVSFNKSNNDPATNSYDVLSKEGNYLMRVILPPHTDLIRDGYLYARDTDPERGTGEIVRYRIRDWEKLSAGTFPAAR